MIGRGWRAIGVLALAVAPAAGAEFNPMGDGSRFDNADLMRPGGGGCENCLPMPPHEWQDLASPLDWSVGLRGAVTQSDSGTRFTSVILSRASVANDILRGSYVVGAESEISYELDGAARVDRLRVDGAMDYRLDEVTVATLGGSLELSQDAPDAPGYGANVVAAPLVVAGEAEVGFSREFGSFSAGLRGSVGRTVFGETEYDDGTSSGNGFQNNSRVGVGSRIGVPVGPGLTAFVDTEIGYRAHDEVSPSLAARLDNVTTEMRAGVSAAVDATLELEGSLGLGHRDFVDASLGDFTAVLYDGRAVLRPDETVELSARLATTIGSPGNIAGATGKVTHELIGEASYRVNPWLKLRSAAGWSEARHVGVGTREQGWSLGAGADYLLNEHMDASLDYVFSRSQTLPDPAEDKQVLTLGLTLHR